MIWCHCRACLCESYEASASEDNNLLHLVVAGAAAGATGAAGALGLRVGPPGLACGTP